jgi:heptaprenyl diphosphate synthase
MTAPEPLHPYERAKALVGEDYATFEQQFDAMLASQRDYLTDAELTFYHRGKRLRPLLLMLSAHLAAQEPGQPLPGKVIASAVSVELSHVGSLIHDDIVDRASTRRGLPTISASRGYELALVIGDLQWIEAVRLLSSFVETSEDIALMREYLDAGGQTCRGQLDEMLATAQSSMGDALVRRYYRTIDRKTGRLVAFCCEGGARLMNGMPSVVGGLRRFGTLYGRAFQVMDDVLDVVRPGNAAGKEALIDLRQGRLSLPLIYQVEELPEGHFLRRVLSSEPLSAGELDSGMRLLRHGNGWIRALGDARAIAARAQTELELLPDNPYRHVLADFTAHLVNQGFLDSYGTQ